MIEFIGMSSTVYLKDGKGWREQRPGPVNERVNVCFCQVNESCCWSLSSIQWLIGWVGPEGGALFVADKGVTLVKGQIEGYKYLFPLLLPQRGEFSLGFPLLKAPLLIKAETWHSRKLRKRHYKSIMDSATAKWISGSITASGTNHSVFYLCVHGS